MPSPPSSNRSILALDLSTSTGWAFRDKDGFITSGVKKFVRPKGLGPLRYTDFGVWLRNVLDGLSPEVVMVEMPHFRGFDPTVLLCGLYSRVQEQVALRGLDMVGCHTGTLKKEVGGRGGASKDEVAASVRAVYPEWTPETDDESDARALILVWDRINEIGSPLSVRNCRVVRTKGKVK